MTTHGAKHIGQLIRANTGLTSLSITGNKNVSIGGWTAIGNALQANAQLKNLELYHNALGDDGLAAICDGLARSKTISAVDLEGNGITDEGGLMVLNWFKSRESLKKVKVKVREGNRIGEEILDQIEALQDDGQAI